MNLMNYKQGELKGIKDQEFFIKLLKELAKALNFPRKSVSGLPVFEVVSFGREPHSLLEGNMDIDI